MSNIRNILFVFAISILFCSKSYAQQSVWKIVGKTVKNTSMNGTDVFISDMKVDYEGNIIVGGTYSDYSQINEKTLNSHDLENAFLAKFDPNGNTLWVRTAPNTTLFKIGINISNEILLCGKIGNIPFEGFNPSKMPKNTTYFYTAKCDKNGFFLWIKKPFIQLDNGATVDFVEWDNNENTYLKISLGNRMKFAFSNYFIQNTNSNTYDLQVVCTLDTNLNLEWIKLDSNVASNNGTGFLSIDKSKSSYFDVTSKDKKNYLSICKIDSSGKVIKKKTLFNNPIGDTTSINFAGSVTDNENNLWLAGNLKGQIQIDGKTLNSNSGYYYKPFLCLFDSNLNLKWITSPNRQRKTIFCTNITKGYKKNEVYLAGIYTDSLQWEGYHLNVPGSQLFISKVDNSGTIEWLRTSNSYYGYNSSLYCAFPYDNNCGDLFLGVNFQYKFIFGDLKYNLSVPYNPFKSDSGKFLLAKFNFDSASIIQDKSYCKGIRLKCSNTAAFSTYKWYYQDSLLGMGNGVNISFKKAGHYPIRLEATNKDGCTALHTDTFMYINPPHAAFYSNDSQGCQWVKYNFIDSSRADTINKAIGERWDWDYGDGKSATYIKRLPISSHIYEKEGDYTVRLVYSNGFCTDTAIKTQKVHILPAPRPGFSIVEGTQGCSPFTIHIQDKSIGQVKKYSYSFGNGDSSHITSAAYVYTKAGNYTLRQQLLGATGCITEDSALIQVKAGIDTTISPVLLRAGFLPDGLINITWKKIANVRQYHIYRSENNAGFIQIANSNSTQFSDVELSEVWQRDSSMQYKITAIDSCGRQSAFSNIGRPVLLKGENIENKYFLLHWTPYQQWEQGAKEYELAIELKDGTFNPINIQNGLSYRDANISDSAKEQCYQVRAIEYLGNGQESYSNVLCLPYLPVIWIPDAFTPDGNGLNDIFRPSVLGIKTYKLSIYSRWGELLYQGNEAGKGWDGQYRGIPAPEGNYLYTLEAIGQNNDDIYRHGTLQLTR